MIWSVYIDSQEVCSSMKMLVIILHRAKHETIICIVVPANSTHAELMPFCDDSLNNAIRHEFYSSVCKHSEETGQGFHMMMFSSHTNITSQLHEQTCIARSELSTSKNSCPKKHRINDINGIKWHFSFILLKLMAFTQFKYNVMLATNRQSSKLNLSQTVSRQTYC